MEHIEEKPAQDADFEPAQKGRWSSAMGWFKRRIKTPDSTSEKKLTFREKLNQLTVSQWFYFLAFIALIVTSEDTNQQEDVATIVIVLCGIGLSREMWHLFHIVWSKTLGKGILLVVYAGTANVALAISAMKINAIAGVEPAPFVFTLGFATLLMLPFWLISATVLFFSVALIVGNLWLMCSILLRLIGIKVPVHWEDKSFVVLTMIIRIIMIPVLIYGLLLLVKPYAEQVNVFETPWLTFDTTPNIENLNEQEKAEVQEVVNALKEKGLVMEVTVPGVEANSDEQQETTANAEVSDEPVEEPAPVDAIPAEEKSRFVDQTIAHFIYHFETYPFSTCKKEPHQRSLVIDDYSVFLAEKDDSPLGYRFSIKACVPRYSEVEKAQL